MLNLATLLIYFYSRSFLQVGEAYNQLKEAVAYAGGFYFRFSYSCLPVRLLQRLVKISHR
jgi:hypothetical protein